MTSNYELQPSDIVTIAGVYRARTFWQWMMRKPKPLQQFTIISQVHDEITIAPPAIAYEARA